MNVSIIIPVINEEALLESSLLKLRRYLGEIYRNFEILICDNGSTDDTEKISRKLQKKFSEIKYFQIPERGLGLGIRKGIEEAEYENLMFYAIDLPFGLEIIKESFDVLSEKSIVIGSKGHTNSEVNISLKRKIVSLGYNVLLRLAFGINVKDTQGSLVFKKSFVEKYLDRLNAKDAFFETELIVWGIEHGGEVVELPVAYSSPRNGTRMKILHDSKNMMNQVWTLRREIRGDSASKQ